MARWVEDEKKIRTPGGRAKLEARPKPYWMGLTEGCHIGYRRVSSGQGSWIVRTKVGAAYREKVVGRADDGDVEADGTKVMTFAQAAEAAQAPRMDAGTAKAPLTVRAVVERYVAYLEANKKTASDTRQRLDKHLMPVLGDRAVASLTKADIESWLHGLVRDGGDDERRKSKDSANRVLGMAKAALNHAIQDDANGLENDSAWRLVRPFKEVGEARAVFLSKAECDRLVAACDGDFRNLVRAALMSGMRYGELAALNVRDLDRDAGCLHLRDGKTGRRDIYLHPEDVPFFADLAGDRDGNEPLIQRSGGRWHKSEQFRPMVAAVKKAKLPPDTVFYSLRHSYASGALLSGMDKQLLAENMGTSIRMLELHYAKFMQETRRALIAKTAPRLA